MRDAALMELDRSLRDLAEQELEPGERVVWAGQPVPRWLGEGVVGSVIVGAGWLAFNFWLIGDGHNWRKLPLDGKLFIGSILAVFVGVGLLMLAAPWFARQKARNTVYLITDRRAVEIVRESFGGRSVRSFEPRRVMQMSRTDRRDGSGDLIFEVVTLGSGSGASTERRGFKNVADVRGVEQRLRETLLAGRVRDVK